MEQVHANIRADPSPEKKDRSEKPKEKKKWKQSKLTYEQRKSNLKVPSQLLSSPCGQSDTSIMRGCHCEHEFSFLIDLLGSGRC